MPFSGVLTASGSTVDNNNVTSGAIDSSGATLGIIVVGWFAGGSLSGVSDSKGNTWTLVDTIAGGTGGQETCNLYYSVLSSVGSGHTFSASGTGGFPSIAALTVIGGVNKSAPVGEKSKASNAASPGSITPSHGNALVIVGCCGNATNTIGTLNGGFTTPVSIDGVAGTSEGVGLGYLIQTTPAAANPAWSGGGSAIAGTQSASFRVFLPSMLAVF